MSRRTFLKNSAALAASAAALQSLSSSVFAAGDDAVKIGLVGMGGRGTGAANQALSTDGKVKLVAVADAFWDVIDDQLKQIANSVKGKPNEFNPEDVQKFGGLDAYKQVIDSDIDMVILATPPGFRPIHFAAAVDKGRHVFMEKPMVTSSEQAHTLAKRFEQTGKVFTIGYNTPCSPAFEFLRTTIRKKTLGRLELVSGYLSQGWLKATAGSWRQNPALSGGGQAYDTWTDYFQPTTPHGSDTALSVGAWNSLELANAYLHFDLSSIPVAETTMLNFAYLDIEEIAATTGKTRRTVAKRPK